MRVALPLGGTDWGQSGIGTYVRAIVPRIARVLAQTKDTLFVLGNRAELDAYESSLLGVEVVRVGSTWNRPVPSALYYLGQAARAARSAGAHVILYPAAQRRFSVLRPIPSVAVMHDLGQMHVADKYDPLRMFYFERVMLPLIAKATRLVAISQATRDDMVRFMGVPAGSIAVIPNGVDLERFAPMAANAPAVLHARQSLGLPERYVLYPSRLEHPAKNHVRLLQAFAESALRESHVLALAGADWGGEGAVRAELARLGLGDRARMLGYVADAVLPGLIAGADVVAMVGLTEGFGLPALEALAAGRPVCAANAAALPEVVGPLASLCDPRSVSSIARALEAAAFDASLRDRAAREGPSWAAARSWDRTAEGLVAECRAALARDSGRSS